MVAPAVFILPEEVHADGELVVDLLVEIQRAPEFLKTAHPQLQLMFAGEERALGVRIDNAAWTPTPKMTELGPRPNVSRSML